MERQLSGWGGSIKSQTTLIKLESMPSFNLIRCSQGVIARGLGRSYGDSAAITGGITLDTCNLKEIAIDTTNGIAVVSSGVTYLELERESLKVGYFPYVVPGTANITVGGAIASDIHGKSHQSVGSISRHLLEIKILTADGNERIIHPHGESSDLFWATIGGMGLTGLILNATIKLKKVKNVYINVCEVRAKNLKTLLSTLLEFNKSYLYTVAWIDLSGRFDGRGIVSGGNHSDTFQVKKGQTSERFSAIQNIVVRIPFRLRFGVINNFTTYIFNRIWLYKPLKKGNQHIQKFMHPLDGIQNWNELYGDRGFVQYQFVIPFEKEEVLFTILEKLRESKCCSPLSVLKSFGEKSRGFLSFPISGWTLSLDLPAGRPKLSEVLREIDQIILEAGGRIYLTKDSRMNSSHLPAMYPDLGRWKEVKAKYDPHNYWQSDQGKRLKLC